MMDNNLLYKIALSMVPGIGGILARNLIAYVGDVEMVFKEPLKRLTKIPGIGEVYAQRIKDSSIIVRADEELAYIEKNQVRVFFYHDAGYPVRFRNCADAPILFYLKGAANLDASRIVSIVGTRNATDYGRQLCDELVRDLAARNPDMLIVSGLAYGVDIQAHKSSLKYQVPTVGVLGHGLDRLYPSAHAKTARSMLEYGGLLTDFPSNTRIDPTNFVRRNRLIAGLADATVVIESGEKGGALITADIASSYDREVFAFPGRASDPYSKGCNQLIKKNVAALIESAADLEYLMGWEPRAKKGSAIQQQLFVELSPDENLLLEILKKQEKTFIDIISHESGMPANKVSALLLEMEFKGVVDVLPGKMYRAK